MATWRQQINQNIVEPSAIQGLPNGKFPASALVDVHDHTGRRIGRLCAAAARSWEAMVAAAWADGIFLDATDSYRTYEVQVSLLQQRYDHTDHGEPAPVITWNGLTWYRKHGFATVATPGHSNHGRGLAVDVHFHGDSLAWLETHAKSFGWQWELASEEWHIHYLPGDHTPQAVIDAEHVHQLTTASEEDDMYNDTLDKAIQARLKELPQNGILDWNGDGGDRTVVWLEAPAKDEHGPAVLVQRVWQGTDKPIRRLLVEAVTPGAIAGPYVDGQRIDVAVQTTDGDAVIVTWDGPDHGPLPGGWHAARPA